MPSQSTTGTQNNRQTDRGTRPATAPRSPGGTSSPSRPGETFDRSSVLGQSTLRAPRVPVNWHALGDEGSTQAIMDVYRPEPGLAMTPADFEQATESEEERRKALSNHPSPDRAVAGYRLLAPTAPSPSLPRAVADVTLKQPR